VATGLFEEPRDLSFPAPAYYLLRNSWSQGSRMVEQGELISWTPASWEPKKRRRRGKREIMKGVVFKPFRDETSEYIVGTYLHPRILGRFTLPNRTRPLDRFFLAVSRVRCRPRLGMVSAETTAYAKKKRLSETLRPLLRVASRPQAWVPVL
jgi:hypothetical protein